jgi:hypothetical protein
MSPASLDAIKFSCLWAERTNFLNFYFKWMRDLRAASNRKT